MEIDVALVPEGFDQERGHGKSAAVIDILRSSATLITALSNGAKCVFLFEDSEKAKEKKKSSDSKNILLCGERDGLKITGFDLGNSPLEYTAGIVQGKTIFFTSTNGSKTMLKASRSARKVIVAGFHNVDAAVNMLIRESQDVVLVCSGKEKRFSLEDAVFAGMLAERIRMKSAKTCHLTDEAFSAVLLYRHFKDDLFGLMHSCDHGKYLKRIGMESDLEYCARVNSTTDVPVFRNGCLELSDS